MKLSVRRQLIRPIIEMIHSSERFNFPLSLRMYWFISWKCLSGETCRGHSLLSTFSEWAQGNYLAGGGWAMLHTFVKSYSTSVLRRVSSQYAVNPALLHVPFSATGRQQRSRYRATHAYCWLCHAKQV